jgi:ion channel-forming bestrophin family protein
MLKNSPKQRFVPPSTRNWFNVLVRWQGSVVPSVMPRVIFCIGFGLVISLLHRQGAPVSWPVLSSIVPSIVLGLLLVFRTNTAYERFWEGRKLWGGIINTSRNLARQLWVSVKIDSSRDRETKRQALFLIVAFAMATKLLLRKESIHAQSELKPFMTSEQLQQLEGVQNAPLEIAFWLGDYLQVQQAKGNINPYQLSAMTELLNVLVDSLGGCERILKTPMPIAYSIHLKQLLMIYCLALPFQIVGELGVWTAVIVGLISFAVFGIEEIGIEIENPFGCDPNDLPLNDICLALQRNIEDLSRFTPGIEATVRQPWQVSALKSATP